MGLVEQSPATSPRTLLLAARRTRRERKTRRTKSSGVAASALLRPLDRAPSRQSSDGSSDTRTHGILGVWQFLYKSVEGVVVLKVLASVQSSQTSATSHTFGTNGRTAVPGNPIEIFRRAAAARSATRI